MNHDEIYYLLKVTKTDFILDGLIAGFSLIVVILLIQGQEFIASDSRYSGMRQGSLFIFSTALFAGILAFFLLLVSISENYYSQRAFTLKMAGDFLFIISVLFILYGMVMMTRVFSLNPVIISLTDKLLYISMIIALFSYASTTKNVISVMYQKTSSEILTQADIIIPIINSFLLCPILAILKRTLDKDHKIKIPSSGFTAFVVISVIAFVIVGLIPSMIIKFSPGAFVPFWLILLFVILFSLLISAMILFIPDKKI